MKTDISWTQVENAAMGAASRINRTHPSSYPIGVYGVPRGGIVPAQLVVFALRALGYVSDMRESPDNADIIIDDILDSGATREAFRKSHPSVPFFPLFTKTDTDVWLSFPWERMSGEELGIEDNVRRLIQCIGDDPERDGLKNTPKRVAESFNELYGGYKTKIGDVLTVFDQTCDEMVVLKDIEFYSTCEHHMLPFYGKAHIAYIPNNGKVVGISKLARVLEAFSRRLQNQERICSDVTSALDEFLEPLGAACVLEGSHFCMQCRGVQKQNSVMVTSSLTGKFRDPAVRAEFFSLIKG